MPEDFLQVHCLPALQGHPRHFHHQCLGAVCLQLDRALALAGAGLAGLRGGSLTCQPAGQAEIRAVRESLRFE
ncbi:hypothetical protein [Pseudomonas aeruginosa]